MLQKLVSNSAPIYPIVLILVLSDRRKIGVHHAPCLIFCIWGGGAPLLRITKKNSLNTYTGPRKKLISPVLFNLWNLFWYQSTQKTKPDTLGYIRISPTEGGSPPRQKNRKKFFKRYLGWTLKYDISPYVIKLRQWFWYQYNRQTVPDTLVYVTISWLEGGSPPTLKIGKILL